MSIDDMDDSWFDDHLERELQKLFEGKVTLNDFKCFIMPNAHYLNLPVGHKAYTIKGILAEHTYDNPGISDERMTEIIKEQLIVRGLCHTE